MEKLERINKYLSESGVCSRREVDELIETQRVEVNGTLARIGMQIDTERDKVYVDGQLVDPEHPEKNAINMEHLAEIKKLPWWEEREKKREALNEQLAQNPKSRLLRKGKKQNKHVTSIKKMHKTASKLSTAEKMAKKQENKKAKTFGEALSDKQKLMNVKTRKLEKAVNPKAAVLRKDKRKKTTLRRKR